MRDTIYRESAIDAVSRGCLEFRGIFAECEKNLNELPPAQSDNGYSDGFADGYKRGLTDAQSEIVRCKDCKHYQFADNRAFGFPVKRCEWTGFEDVDDDDFCSRAERRTND